MHHQLHVQQQHSSLSDVSEREAGAHHGAGLGEKRLEVLVGGLEGQVAHKHALLGVDGHVRLRFPLLRRCLLVAPSPVLLAGLRAQCVLWTTRGKASCVSCRKHAASLLQELASRHRCACVKVMFLQAALPECACVSELSDAA